MNVNIASRLVALRKKFGYSQESLAEQLGISRQAISKWERAEASPDTDNLITLANLYGISLDDLLNTKKDLPDDVQSKDRYPGQRSNDRGNYDYSIQFNDDSQVDTPLPFDGADAEQKVFQSDFEIEEPERFAENFDRMEEDFERATEKNDQRAGGSQGADKSNRKSRNSIHIKDGDSIVHIGKDGIRVLDKKDGTKVDVGWKGVRLSDGEFCINVDDNPDLDDETGDNESWIDLSDKKKNLFQRLPLGVLSTIAFFLIGSLTGIWHPTWMVFLLVPVVDSFITAVVKRDLHKFAYPVLAFDVFLWIGFVHNLWHPGWVIFLTIPVYYAIFPKKNKGRTHIHE